MNHFLTLQSLKISVISLNLSRKLFVLPSKSLEVAAKRGVVFEITTLPIYGGSESACREALGGGKALVSVRIFFGFFIGLL